MKPQKKAITRQQALEQQPLQHNSEHTVAAEFSTVEEMLRLDGSQTPVPPAIAQRLEESIRQLPPPRRSWWRRFLGGTAP